MKKLAVLTLAILPLLASCDQVDVNDRYIEVENRPFDQKVLLEEFTGQNCVNCPEAHAVIERLQEQFEDNFIVVSIHAGSFGIPAEYGGLMQPEGDEYAKNWDINAYPCGVIARKSGVLNSDGWSAAIRSVGTRASSMQMNLSAELSPDEKTISINTDLLAEEAVKGNLQLYVVENGIVALQRDGSKRVYDYVHNNVFRATVNGIWGEKLEMVNNESEHFNHTIEVRRDAAEEIDNWNVDNLYIVGFVYDDNGVLVVDKCKVK